MKHRTVEDLMTKDVVSVRPDTTFKEIAGLLATHNISAVPVTDHQGRVIGVVSEADLMRRLAPAQHRRGWRRLRPARKNRMIATSLMSTPAVTVATGADLTTTAQLLAHRKIKRAPVVDAEGRIVGIVSRHDLVRVFVRPDEAIRDEIRDDLLPRALFVDPAGVDIQVSQGVVTLTGQLERASLVPITEAMVARVDGVVDVVNHLTYQVDDTKFDDGTAPQNVGILHSRRGGR